MKWCKYHGVLTPASYQNFSRDGGLICGYQVVPESPSAVCTSQVRDVETWNLDDLDNLGTRAKPPAVKPELFMVMGNGIIGVDSSLCEQGVFDLVGSDLGYRRVSFSPVRCSLDRDGDHVFIGWATIKGSRFVVLQYDPANQLGRNRGS